MLRQILTAISLGLLPPMDSPLPSTVEATEILLSGAHETKEMNTCWKPLQVRQPYQLTLNPTVTLYPNSKP